MVNESEADLKRNCETSHSARPKNRKNQPRITRMARIRKETTPSAMEMLGFQAQCIVKSVPSVRSVVALLLSACRVQRVLRTCRQVDACHGSAIVIIAIRLHRIKVRELLKQVRIVKEYTVIYEPGPRNWSAYVPDLPGCIATAKTRKAIERQIREAIEFHIESLRRQGEDVPEPSIEAAVVSVSS
jgi:predicted RNase H-like HicB family nuclease